MIDTQSMSSGCPSIPDIAKVMVVLVHMYGRSRREKHGSISISKNSNRQCPSCIIARCLIEGRFRHTIRGGLEERHEVARENMSSGYSSSLVEQLAAPPAIFRRRSNSNNIPSLEIKLFIDGSLVVIECLYCEGSQYTKRELIQRVDLP